MDLIISIIKSVNKEVWIKPLATIQSLLQITTRNGLAANWGKMKHLKICTAKDAAGEAEVHLIFFNNSLASYTINMQCMRDIRRQIKEKPNSFLSAV
ncbi:uncharacterized protein V6R79_010105 [Siganus canaliculatus]